jgi:MFS family permease
MLFAAFTGVEVFLALLITTVLGYSTGVTGAVIATGSISWAVGSWLQSRLDSKRPEQRPQRLFFGTTLITAGIVAQLGALWLPGPTLPLVVAGWIVAGLGIGMAHSTASVLAFALAPAGDEGKVSAALQIADQFTAAFSTGVGGALLAMAARLDWSPRSGVLMAIAFVLILAGLALMAARRSSV